jgi:hypothetical protein
LGSNARDNVGVLCCGGEGRDVERALVNGVHVLAIWEASEDGLVGWVHVGHGGSSSEKVTFHTRVKDGPCSHGGHTNIDNFE